MSFLGRLRALLGRASDDEPSRGPSAEDRRLDATSAAVLHNAAANPDAPGSGLPPPGDVATADEGRPRK